MIAQPALHIETAQPLALIYCRVSSRAQETLGHGLESQETRCRQHAANLGMDVVAVFPDTITGGGDFMQRPGMLAMLSFIDSNPNDNFVIIFDDLKRASRDTRAFLDLRDAFRSRNTRVECLNFKFDDTPEGEFIETIIAAQGACKTDIGSTIRPSGIATRRSKGAARCLCQTHRLTGLCAKRLRDLPAVDSRPRPK